MSYLVRVEGVRNDVKRLIGEVGAYKIASLVHPKDHVNGLSAFMQDNPYLRCGQALVVLSEAKGVYSELFHCKVDATLLLSVVIEELINEDA